MEHSHHHNINNKFLIGIVLNLIFIVAEVFYGLKANSLALIADAVHNVGDVLGLLVAWGGFWLADKKAPKKFTYGYKNATIIAACINAILLFIAVAGIIWEAIPRFGKELPIASQAVIIVAFIGVLINGLTAYFFFHDRQEDINLQGAFLHMLLDMLVSVGVIIAGFFIMWQRWYWLDPMISVVIGLIILWSSWGLFRESLNLMLVAVPTAIDIEKLRAMILSFKGLIDVHDLHIWPISTAETALSAHLVVESSFFKDDFYRVVEQRIKAEFPISHVTLQMELKRSRCVTECQTYL